MVDKIAYFVNRCEYCAILTSQRPMVGTMQGELKPMEYESESEDDEEEEEEDAASTGTTAQQGYVLEFPAVIIYHCSFDLRSTWKAKGHDSTNLT